MFKTGDLVTVKKTESLLKRGVANCRGKVIASIVSQHEGQRCLVELVDENATGTLWVLSTDLKMEGHDVPHP